MTHTPGPWTVDWDYDEGWNHHIESSPGNRICFMAHDGADHQKQFDANARLIAAAPDMLAALKDLLAIIDAQRWGRPWAGRPHAEADAALAAIAKAEGRS